MRDSFLIQVCGGDRALLRDVQSLLCQDDATVLIDRPVWATAARLFQVDSDLGPGATLGPYRIDGLLGAGGMGEVFSATDIRLNRRVALKVILGGVVIDQHVRVRFAREAEAVAALTHPHIRTLYDVGRHDEIDFLVMEHLEGETLGARLAKGALPVELALSYAKEIASALDHAHLHGVIHRDLKPANIMVTAGGTKLLDFGLAKFRRAEGHVAAAADDTGASPSAHTELDQRAMDHVHLTRGGTVLGTARYMAPEQITGHEVDARSDLFSFGAVLYEMFTGQRAFEGDTAAKIREAILAHEPLPVSSHQPLVPPAIDAIVGRCLAKNRDERWQTAGAVLRELEQESEPRRLAGTPARDERAGVLLEGPQSRDTVESGPPGPTRPAYALAAAAALVVATGALVWTTLADTAATQVTPPRPALQVVPVTSMTAPKEYPALSPDGSRVAFMSERDGGVDVYVKRVDSEATVRLTRSPGGGGAFPAWSPDGRFVAYLRRSRSESGLNKDEIVMSPAGGGAEQTLFSDPLIRIGSGLDWSPDGEHLVFAANSRLGQPMRVMLVSVSGGPRRWLTAPPPGTGGDRYPTFSPDGNSVAFVRDTDAESSLHLLALADETSTRLTTAAAPIRKPAWLADGHALIYALDQGGGAGLNTLWRISLGGGDPAPVTGTGPGASDPSTARFRARVVFTQTVLNNNLYRAELTGVDVGRITPLVTATRRDTHPDISPDGTRIAFVSDRTGQAEIWVADASGANPRRVTELKTNARNPRWSPDGRRIAFSAQPSAVNHVDLYIAEADAGVSQRLTFDASNEHVPTWSADGRWVFFMSDRSGTREIWKVPASGGRAEQVTTGGGLKAWESRDGRFLYLSNDAPAIWRQATAGTEPTLVFRLPAFTAWGGEWSLSDHGIYWVNRQASPLPAIEFFDFAAGASTRVVAPSGLLDEGGLLSVAPDGQWLVFNQRDYHSSDIMMIDGFK